MKNKLNNLLIISIVLFILVILIISYFQVFKIDTFIIKPVTTKQSITTKPQPIDRTKLYGALFLENIEESIKNLSNPDIQYEENRIQLNNYSDILL